MILKSGKTLEEFLLEGMSSEDLIKFMDKQLHELSILNPSAIWVDLTEQFKRRQRERNE